MALSDSPEPLDYRRSILLSYFSTLFFWGAVYVYMPILAPYSRMVSGSLQSAGLVMGAYGLAQFMFRIPLGIGSDRWRRRKPFFLLGFVFDGLASLGLLLSGSTAMLFLSVFTAGIAASMWVPSIVLFTSYFPAGKIAHSMSLILFFTRLAQILSNYAGGAIADLWGWTAPFYAGILLSATGFFLAAGMSENRPGKTAAASFRQLLLLGRNPLVLTPSIVCALLQFTIFSTTFGFTPIYAQQIGASKGQLGFLLFYYMLTNTLATLLSGTFARRWLSERQMVLSGFVLIAAAVFLVPLAARVEALFVLQAVHGIGVGLLFPLLMGLAIQPIPREQQATAMGIYQCVYAFGMTLGPILSGLIAQPLGISWVFVFNGLLCLCGAYFGFLKISSGRSEPRQG
jgi:MFS family permease